MQCSLTALSRSHACVMPAHNRPRLRKNTSCFLRTPHLWVRLTRARTCGRRMLGSSKSKSSKTRWDSTKWICTHCSIGLSVLLYTVQSPRAHTANVLANIAFHCCTGRLTEFKTYVNSVVLPIYLYVSTLGFEKWLLFKPVPSIRQYHAARSTERERLHHTSVPI